MAPLNTDLVAAALLVFAAYLVGGIPFGYLLGRLHGIDIRQHGSRNIGATNVGRVLGRKWGFFCLGLDILKGAVPTLVARAVLFDGPASQAALIKWMAVGLAAVLGHVFPVYLKFRGGKGVATTVGVALAVYPYFTLPLGVALLGYAIGRWATGLVSVGSLSIAVLFPVSVYGLLAVKGLSLEVWWPLQAVATLLGLLIIVRHAGNLRRLLAGREIPPTGAGGIPLSESPPGSDRGK